MSISKIINPAGGFYYHLKALKYKKKLWSPFIGSLKIFLEKWQPKSKNLVIFGGSGGYCLNKEFINRFHQITLIDPDPLAAIIFRFRFHRKIKSVKKNYLLENQLDLDMLLKDFPDHAFLFSNILGQLPYLISFEEKVISSLQLQFENNLSDREWVSFHDLMSFHFTKAHPRLCWPLILQGKDNLETIDKLQQQTNLRPLKLQAIDHCTENIFENYREKQKYYWQRTPHSYHVIEAVSHIC